MKEEQPDIYTRTGDDGTTALGDGERVAKGHDRIEAYGTVEELNAAISLALEHLRPSPPNILYRVAPGLTRVQNELYDLCSELATPPRMWQDGMPCIQPVQTECLERLIDRCAADLPPLRSHALPGGGLPSAALHLCRAVCRRTERAVLRLAQKEVVRPESLRYLNRLGDLLFALARWVQMQSGEPELTWQPGATLCAPPPAPQPAVEDPESEPSSVGFQRVL